MVRELLKRSARRDIRSRSSCFVGKIYDFVPQKLSASADDHQRAQAAEGSEIDRRDKRMSQEIIRTGSLAFLMDWDLPVHLNLLIELPLGAVCHLQFDPISWEWRPSTTGLVVESRIRLRVGKS